MKEFLSKIPERLKKTIKTVCTDMYEGYINAFKETFNKKEEQVKKVIDRFNVSKNYRNCVEYLRKSEIKRIKKELDQE